MLADGKVGTVTVARSLDGGTFGLDQEAVKAAKQWTFKPGRKNGKPVAVRISIELMFRFK
jgi:TonB family protein